MGRGDNEQIEFTDPYKFAGVSKKPSPTGVREQLPISQHTKQQLTALVFEPQMRGVGYSEFVERVIAGADQCASFPSQQHPRREEINLPPDLIQSLGEAANRLGLDEDQLLQRAINAARNEINVYS